MKELEAEARAVTTPGPSVSERPWRILSHAKSIGEPSGLRRIRDLEQRIVDSENKRKEVETRWQNLSAQYSAMALMQSRGEQRAAVLEQQLSEAKRKLGEDETAIQILTTRVRDAEADARTRVSELEGKLRVAESQIAMADSKEKALRDLSDAHFAESLVHQDERQNAVRRFEAREEEILRLKKEKKEMHSMVLDEARRRAKAEKENQELKAGVGEYVFWLLRVLGISHVLLVVALGWAACTYFTSA